MSRPDAKVTRAAPWMGGGSLLSGLAWLLLPKCPLCIAPLLGALGLGSGAAAVVAPWVRPLAMVFAVSMFLGLSLALSRLRRRRRAELATCCRAQAI